MNGEPAEQSLNRLARQLARLSGSGPRDSMQARTSTGERDAKGGWSARA